MKHPTVCFLLVLCGCSASNAPTTTPVAATATPVPTVPVPVVLTQPKSVTLNWNIEQPATAHAFESAPLMVKIPGYVSKVHVDIGDTVKENQILAELSVPELLLEAEQKKSLVIVAEAEQLQAKKGVEVAKAQIISAESMVAQAKAGIARAEADAKRWLSEQTRIQGLVNNRVVDAQTLDETNKQYQAALAGTDEAAAKVKAAEQMVNETKAKTERANADVTAAEARKAVAIAEAGRVAAMLEYTKIRAPFAGTITMRTIHTGHFLQPNSGKSEPIFVVSRQDIVRVFVDIPEAASGKTAAGTKATVRFPALSIDIPNSDGAIKPGMYARANLSTSTAQALVLPNTAILFADETAYCYRVEGGKAVKLRVQVGKPDGANLEVVGCKRASGPPSDWKPFDGTESIVVGNLGAIADGQDVVEKK
jgi:HlyD family secretion protein